MPAANRITAPSGTGERLGTILSFVLLAAMLLANITWILVDQDTRLILTLVGVLLFAATSFTHSTITFGLRWSTGFLLIALVFGLCIEALGTATGFPFGSYYYTAELAPQLLDVPLVVPLAWYMMAYPVWIVSTRSFRNPALATLLATAFLATWDIFLDPQMVGENYWVWNDLSATLPGIENIPISNFAGWWLASLILATLLTVLAGTNTHELTNRQILVPTLLLAWVYVGNIVANAVFLGRLSVALWGGVAMGVPVAIWCWRTRPWQVKR